MRKRIVTLLAGSLILSACLPSVPPATATDPVSPPRTNAKSSGLGGLSGLGNVLASIGQAATASCLGKGTHPPASNFRCQPVEANRRAALTLPHKRIEGGYILTRDITIETQTLGPITISKGYKWDGDTLVRDAPESRRASLVHDALFTGSVHLKSVGHPYTQAMADLTYFELTCKDGLPKAEAVRRYEGLQKIGAFSWCKPRLAQKREARFREFGFIR